MQDHITPDFEFRWIEDGHILVVRTIDTSTREKTDAYYEILNNFIRNWPDEKPYLLFFDSTQALKENWTPYMRQRAEEAHSLIPSTVKGRTASVLRPSLLARMVRIFVEQGLNRKNPQVKLRIFFKYDEAMNWLKEGIPKNVTT